MGKGHNTTLRREFENANYKVTWSFLDKVMRKDTNYKQTEEGGS